jgi:CheB methylesterase
LRTGRGEDGAEGLGAIKAAGGMTIAQSEDTCVVSGMPRAAIQKGHANKILPLENIGTFLVSQYGGGDRVVSEKTDRAEKSDRQEKLEKNEKTPVSSQRT